MPKDGTLAGKASTGWGGGFGWVVHLLVTVMWPGCELLGEVDTISYRAEVGGGCCHGNRGGAGTHQRRLQFVRGRGLGCRGVESRLGMGRVGSCTQGPAPSAGSPRQLLGVPFHLKTLRHHLQVHPGSRILQTAPHPVTPPGSWHCWTPRPPSQPFLYTFVPSPLAQVCHPD